MAVPVSVSLKGRGSLEVFPIRRGGVYIEQVSFCQSLRSSFGNCALVCFVFCGDKSLGVIMGIIFWQY